MRKRPENIEHLRKMREFLPILPDRLPAMYTAARTALIDPKYEAVDDDWPADYQGSLRHALDQMVMHATDIALHAPPHDGRYAATGEPLPLESTVPSLRFARIVEVFHGLQEPLQVDDGPNYFYAALYDKIAEKCGWPTFSDTMAVWIRRFWGVGISPRPDLRRAALAAF